MPELKRLHTVSNTTLNTLQSVVNDVWENIELVDMLPTPYQYLLKAYVYALEDALHNANTMIQDIKINNMEVK